MTLEFKKGHILFAGGEEHLEEAKAYIRIMQLTRDDVRIYLNKGGQLLIEAKRNIKLPESAKKNLA